jgi:hypothetical protein
MDYTKAIEIIKLKRRQGLYQIVARKTGVFSGGQHRFPQSKSRH